MSSSILDGGFVGAIRHLRQSEPSLSLSNALADANMQILEAVLNFNGGSIVNVPTPGVGAMSLAARIRQSVGEVNTNLHRAATTTTTAPAPAAVHTAPPPPPVGSFMSMASTFMKPPPRISENLDNNEEDEDSLASLTSKISAQTGESHNEQVDGLPESLLMPLPSQDGKNLIDASPLPSTPPPPLAAAASYFGGFGKKMSAFGASSLETVRNNIAAAQLAHQQQQELLKQQQLQQPQPQPLTGGVLWSSDVSVAAASSSSPSSSSSSSSARGPIEGGMQFMGGLRSAIVSKINTARGGPLSATGDDKDKDKVHVHLAATGSGSTFVIDEEDDAEEDDGMGPREIDPHKICISKTDAERAQVQYLSL